MEHSFEMSNSNPAKKSKTYSVKWRNAAIFASLVALLLSVGLAATLGIFLIENECRPPPTHDLATTNYSGTAEAGSLVAYVCPRPYVFPNNNDTFTIRCSSQLKWENTEIPPCSRQAAKKCAGLVQDENFDLSLDIEDSISSLEVKLTFTGQLPNTLLVDIPSDEKDKCSIGVVDGEESNNNPSPYEYLRFKRLFLSALMEEEEQISHTVTITDTKLDAATPYEIRIRGAGDVLAVALVQANYLNITLHYFPTKSDTSTESSAPPSRLTGSTRLSSRF